MKLATKRATNRARRSLSLRARLLAGLIALTTIFLVVMGVVTTIVLGTLERDQLNAEVRLAASQSVTSMAAGVGGFSAAYLSVDSGATGTLTPDSGTADTLLAEARSLKGLSSDQVSAKLQKLAGYERPFDLTISGQPTVRAAWRWVPSKAIASAASKHLLPYGSAVILVGRPASEANNNMRGIVLTELITGGAIIALLAVCGNWLIGRGLAPLRRMASTANLITRSGDLAARMPDADDQQETGRLASAINTMLDRIQQSFSARLNSEQKVRQFAADASHELRTPLTTIRGYAELYRANVLGPDEMPSAMRRIEQEAERMSLLVAELLELARLDRPGSLDLSETDLTVLANDAVADARAVEPGRELRATGPDSLVITADEPRIRQVFANLLSNVRAHTPPGTPATVKLYPHQGGAVIEVSDRGPGMSEHDATLAFDRFHRGERALAAATTGRPKLNGHDGTEVANSGLGLAIVQAIATAHGGYADLTSTSGEGTTVRLWIPTKNLPLENQDQ
ncbi:MAG TPA: HAMP domain-containing sensor histidine kinase [Trebonia sp.]|nr:HAMP domain-containing sensor histidine kinase [Trebonia sp.]